MFIIYLKLSVQFREIGIEKIQTTKSAEGLKSITLFELQALNQVFMHVCMNEASNRLLPKAYPITKPMAL